MKIEAALVWLCRATLFAAVSGASVASAQVPYTLTESARPYQPLTNGTVINFSSRDDGEEPVPLGFELSHYGQTMAFAYVSVNGSLALSPACGAGNTCPTGTTCRVGGCISNVYPISVSIPSIVPPPAAVAIFSEDLILNTGGANQGDVLWGVSGTAPTRVMTIEWRNIRQFGNPGGAASFTQFQVHLHEGSGVIEFHYGPFTSGSDNGSWDGEVGIEDYAGMESLEAPCSGMCTSADLMTWENRVLRFARIDGPELIASIVPPTGGNPGDPMPIRVSAHNIGTETTTVAVLADVYLSTDATIEPANDTLLGQVDLGFIADGSVSTATLAATVPLGLMPGFYSVGVIVDPGQLVGEFNRSDNVAVRDDFLVGAELSIRVDSVVVGAPGQPTPIEFVLLNAAAAQPSVGWSLYLSSDPTFDAMDLPLDSGTAAVPAVPETPVTTQVVFPMVPAGDYYVIGVVDEAGQIAEANEMNNSDASDVFLVGPELSVEIRGPAASGPGEVAPVEVILMNIGSAVGDVAWTIYLSEDSAFDSFDAEVATGTSALGAARSLAVAVNVTVPVNTLPTDQYFIAVIDPADVIDEVDENNNAGVAPSPTVIVGPDIVAVEVSGAPRFFLGGSYRVEAVLRNDGGATARNFFYAFHLSDNQLITVTDPLLGEIGPIDLEPGEQISVQHTLPASSSIAPGLYYLGLIADSTSQVLEELETNNIKRWQAQQVEARSPSPDFAISTLRAPTAGAAGETLVVERVIDNAGNADGTVDYVAYLSSDTVHDAADREFGRGQIPLTAGRSATGVDAFTVPVDLLAGSYFLIYTLDPDNTVDELEEGNNLAVSGGAVLIEAAPLQLLTTTLPLATIDLDYEVDLAAVGGSGPLTWTIGGGALPPGLSLGATTGRISGRPGAEGAYQVTISVSDGALSIGRTFDMLVSGPTVGLKVVTRSVPPAWVGRTYEYALTALGGVKPYRWTASDPLPRGITLSPEGQLAGIPVTPANVIVNFRVTDANGLFDTQPIALRAITLNDAVRFSTDTLDAAVVRRMYEATLRAVNGVSPYSFALAEGALPPGLSLEGDRVTGIPTTSGTYTFALRVTDNRGDFDVNRFVVIVTSEDALNFVTTGLPVATKGEAYVDVGGTPVRVKAIGGGDNSDIRYTIVAGELPPGLTLAEDGLLDGAPTSAGVFDVMVMAVDALNQTDVGAFGILVLDTVGGPMIEPEPDSGCGCAATDTPRSTAPWAWLLMLGLPLLRRRRSAAGLLGRGGALGAAAGVAILVAVPSVSSAQTPYFSTQANEPYVELMGGMPVSFSSTDDGSATAQLPFNFRFFSNDYGSVTMGTNGYITFGSSGTSLANQNFPNASNPDNLIAAVWDDLINPSTTIHVEGSMPNRRVVIQYRNVGRFGQSGASVNFQFRLYEGLSGRFEVAYGPAVPNGTFSFSGGYENDDGSVGDNFTSCNPNCTLTDLQALNGMVFGALQDAGEDVIAGGLAHDQLVYAGVPFGARSTLTSQTQQPLGPFSYSIHLLGLADDTVDNPVFTSTAPVTLNPYETRTVSDQIAVPLSTPEGRYRLALEVDSTDSIVEPNEQNNIVISTMEIRVAERRPDFRGSVQAPAGPLAPGGAADLSVTLENAGNLEGTTAWRLVLSPNRIISADDVTLTDGSITLGPLSSNTATVSVALPASLVPGLYYFGLILDPENTVSELNEVNNTGASAAVPVSTGSVEVGTMTAPLGYTTIAYSMFLRGIGGDGRYAWGITSGDLPPGLGLIPSTGQVRGDPTMAGSYPVEVEVQSAGQSATRNLTFEIRDVEGGLTIVTRELLPGLVGQAYPPTPVDADPRSQQILIALGAMGNAEFSLDNPAPPGLQLDTDGLLYGVPTQRGVFDLAVRVTDGTQTATRALSLTIAESGRLTLVASNLPDAVVEETYEYRLQVLGAASSSVSFSLVGGPETLPAGLALTQDGLIVGTPIEVISKQFAVEVVEGNAPGAPRDTANFRLVVRADAGFGITPTALPPAVLGEPYDATLEARGGNPTFVWRVDPVTSIPRGLRWEVETDAMNRERVRFLGSPEALPADGTGGIATFLVAVSDSAGRTAQLAVSIRVTAPISDLPEIEPDSGCGCASSGAPDSAPISAAALALGALAIFVRRRRRTFR